MRVRIGALIDRAQTLAARHERLIGWLSTGWLIVLGLSAAGLFPLPEVDLLEGRAAMIAGVVWNAVWWAALRPALERRKARAAVQETAEAA